MQDILSLPDTLAFARRAYGGRFVCRNVTLLHFAKDVGTLAEEVTRKFCMARFGARATPTTFDHAIWARHAGILHNALAHGATFDSISQITNVPVAELVSICTPDARITAERQFQEYQSSVSRAGIFPQILAYSISTCKALMWFEHSDSHAEQEDEILTELELHDRTLRRLCELQSSMRSIMERAHLTIDRVRYDIQQRRNFRQLSKRIQERLNAESHSTPEPAVSDDDFDD